jgi:putative ABC transport system permease protein
MSLMPEMYIECGRYYGNVFISGIFKDIPETSHFHTDILLHLPDEYELYTYVYLLLQKSTDTKVLAQKITQQIKDNELFHASKTHALLMPLTDIHLHSHNLREMSVNGNMYYIYLIVGANALLLIVVLFNLWLNASLIFSYNRRYYQILRLHGARSTVVFKDETLSALFLGIISVIAGTTVAFCISTYGLNILQSCGLLFMFLLSVIAVSLLPALKGIATTLFLNTDNDWKPIRFSYSNVKWMLMVQYAVVMIVVILAFGINKQMNLVRTTQVGGNERHILVMADQPEQVQAKYELLKTELLKHTEIESVTSSFQLPGDAIRDVIGVGKVDDIAWRTLPVMVAGADLLPFFGIRMIAGQGFFPAKYDYQNEANMMSERRSPQKI